MKKLRRFLATALSIALVANHAMAGVTAPVFHTEPTPLSNLASLLEQNGVRLISEVAKKPLSVLLIQDVHLNPEAQLIQANALTELINSGRVGFIGVEGAISPFETDRLRAYAAPLRESVAKQYVRAKRLSGISLASLIANSPLPVITGIDSQTDYSLNHAALKEAQKNTTTLQARLKSIENQKFKSIRNNNHSFVNFISKLRKYESGQITPLELAKNLSKWAPPPPTLKLFLHLSESEIQLNTQAATAEQHWLLQQLSQQLSVLELRKLTRLALLARTNPNEKQTLHQLLRRHSQQSNFLNRHTQHFSAFVDYERSVAELDGKALHSELKQWRETVARALCASPEQQSTYKTLTQIWLTQKLVRFSLSPDEWDAYQHSRWTDPDVRPFERFYEAADRRSEAMAENLLRQSSPLKVTVVIAGGFHTPRLKATLERAGRTCAVFSPRLTRVTNEQGTAYLSAFAQEHSPLERFFQGERLFLCPSFVHIADEITSRDLEGSLAVREHNAAEGQRFRFPTYSRGIPVTAITERRQNPADERARLTIGSAILIATLELPLIPGLATAFQSMGMPKSFAVIIAGMLVSLAHKPWREKNAWSSFVIRAGAVATFSLLSWAGSWASHAIWSFIVPSPFKLNLHPRKILIPSEPENIEISVTQDVGDALNRYTHLSSFPTMSVVLVNLRYAIRAKQDEENHSIFENTNMAPYFLWVLERHKLSTDRQKLSEPEWGQIQEHAHKLIFRLPSIEPSWGLHWRSVSGEVPLPLAMLFLIATKKTSAPLTDSVAESERQQLINNCIALLIFQMENSFRKADIPVNPKSKLVDLLLGLESEQRTRLQKIVLPLLSQWDVLSRKGESLCQSLETQNAQSAAEKLKEHFLSEKEEGDRITRLERAFYPDDDRHKHAAFYKALDTMQEAATKTDFFVFKNGDIAAGERTTKGTPAPASLDGAWVNPPKRLPASLYFQLLLIQRMAQVGYKSWFFESAYRYLSVIFQALPGHEQDHERLANRISEYLRSDRNIPLRKTLELSPVPEKNAPELEQSIEFWEALRWLRHKYNLDIVLRHEDERGKDIPAWILSTPGKKALIGNIAIENYGTFPNGLLQLFHQQSVPTLPSPFRWREAIAHAVHNLNKWGYVRETRTVGIPILKNRAFHEVMADYLQPDQIRNVVGRHADYWLITNDDGSDDNDQEQPQWGIPIDFYAPTTPGLSPVGMGPSPVMTWSILLLIMFGAAQHYMGWRLSAPAIGGLETVLTGMGLAAIVTVAKPHAPEEPTLYDRLLDVLGLNNPIALSHMQISTHKKSNGIEIRRISLLKAPHGAPDNKRNDLLRSQLADNTVDLYDLIYADNKLIGIAPYFDPTKPIPHSLQISSTIGARYFDFTPYMQTDRTTALRWKNAVRDYIKSTALPSMPSNNGSHSDIVRLTFQINDTQTTIKSQPVDPSDYNPSILKDGDKFSVEIPLLPTVYPPQGTAGTADEHYSRAVMRFEKIYKTHHARFGSTKEWNGGRRILVRGAGSGVDLIAAYLAWLRTNKINYSQALANPTLQPHFTINEINPIAVAGLKDLVNRLGLRNVTFGHPQGTYDLVLWNMPQVSEGEMPGSDVGRLESFQDYGEHSRRMLTDWAHQLPYLLSEDGIGIFWNGIAIRNEGRVMDVASELRHGDTNNGRTMAVTRSSILLNHPALATDVYFVTHPIEPETSPIEKPVAAPRLVSPADQKLAEALVEKIKMHVATDLEISWILGRELYIDILTVLSEPLDVLGVREETSQEPTSTVLASRDLIGAIGESMRTQLSDIQQQKALPFVAGMLTMAFGEEGRISDAVTTDTDILFGNAIQKPTETYINGDNPIAVNSALQRLTKIRSSGTYPLLVLYTNKNGAALRMRVQEFRAQHPYTPISHAVLVVEGRFETAWDILGIRHSMNRNAMSLTKLTEEARRVSNRFVVYPNDTLHENFFEAPDNVQETIELILYNNQGESIQLVGTMLRTFENIRRILTQA